LGTEREWPYCGEIDIMEYYQESLFANFAWGKVRRWDAKWHSSARPLSKLAAEAGFASVEDWSSHFHVWRMDWDEDRIRLYVDDKLLNEVALTDTVNEGDHVNPFHSPQRLILDLAIGGINGGDPSGAKFPAKFEIAYVRVYRRA
jgi:beta-glucanase (GH16 family)